MHSQYRLLQCASFILSITSASPVGRSDVIRETMTTIADKGVGSVPTARIEDSKLPPDTSSLKRIIPILTISANPIVKPSKTGHLKVTPSPRIPGVLEPVLTKREYNPRLGFDVSKHNPMCGFPGHICPCGQIPQGRALEGSPGSTPPILEPWTPECDIRHPDDKFDYRKHLSSTAPAPNRRAIATPAPAVTHDSESPDGKSGRLEHRCSSGENHPDKPQSGKSGCDDSDSDSDSSDSGSDCSCDSSSSSSSDSGSDSASDSGSDDSSDDCSEDEAKTRCFTANIVRAKSAIQEHARNFKPFYAGRYTVRSKVPTETDVSGDMSSDDDTLDTTQSASAAPVVNTVEKRAAPVQTPNSPKPFAAQPGWTVIEKAVLLRDGITRKTVRIAFRFEGNRMVSKVLFKPVDDKSPPSSDDDYQYLCETENGHTTCRENHTVAGPDKGASPVNNGITHGKNETHPANSTTTTVSLPSPVLASKRGAPAETSNTPEPLTPNSRLNPIRAGGLSPGNHGGFASKIERELTPWDLHMKPETLADTLHTHDPVLAVRSIMDGVMQSHEQLLQGHAPVLYPVQDPRYKVYQPAVSEQTIKTVKGGDSGPYVPIVPFIDFRGALISGRPHRKGPTFASDGDSGQAPRTSSAVVVGQRGQMVNDDAAHRVRSIPADKNGETLRLAQRFLGQESLAGAGESVPQPDSVEKRDVPGPDVVIVEVHQTIGTVSNETTKNETVLDLVKKPLLRVTEFTFDRNGLVHSDSIERAANPSKLPLGGVQDEGRKHPNQSTSNFKPDRKKDEASQGTGARPTSAGVKEGSKTVPGNAHFQAPATSQTRAELYRPTQNVDKTVFNWPTPYVTGFQEATPIASSSRIIAGHTQYQSAPTLTNAGQGPVQIANLPLPTEFGWQPAGYETNLGYPPYQLPPYFLGAATKHHGLAVHWVILFAIIIASLLC